MFEIYRNLHTLDKFSIREKGGRVLTRLSDFVAYNVSFKVREGGREKVLQEKRKNVHAFVVTPEFYEIRLEVSSLPRISYNPYKSSSFMCDEVPIFIARQVAFSGGRCFLVDK